MAEDFSENVVVIDDLLKEIAGLEVLGVQIKNNMLCVTTYFKLPNGEYFHRDLNIRPNGSYDSGSITTEHVIRSEIERIQKEHSNKSDKEGT